MNIPFYKYQGTGNDFILIDNRSLQLSLSREQVARMCDRRFGIGADGLMLLGTAPGYDFTMTYFNADGGESSMCGNGGRCIAAFAKRLGLVSGDQTFFRAIDGPHQASFLPSGTVALQMNDVGSIGHFDGYSLLNTGSPHYVLWTEQVAAADVRGTGRSIRNQAAFAPDGINVNFAERNTDGSLVVRTYERGVEDETFSCGTGVTAAAIAATGAATGDFDTPILTPGGRLSVRFRKQAPDAAKDVVLTGPATFVFQGMIDIN